MKNSFFSFFFYKVWQRPFFNFPPSTFVYITGILRGVLINCKIFVQLIEFYMGFLPSGVRDLKFKHRFKYCICNKIMRHENLEHSLASIGVYRGFPTPVKRSGCPNYVPKLMKNSFEKISLIQILGNNIFIAHSTQHKAHST